MAAKKSTPIIVGLDHGNGWVKVKTTTNEIVLPSYIAAKEDISEGLTAKKLDLKVYESSTEKGNEYVWGNDVLKANKIKSTYGSQDRYKQPYYKLLNQFALVEGLLNGEETIFENVWVITGVPSEEKGTSAEADLKATLEGTHLVKVEGVDKIVKVTKVVVLPQPIGTIMSKYLDTKGFVAEDEYESNSVGIIDVGTGTTDLDKVKELRRNGEAKSIPMGMFDIYKNVAKYIKHQNPSVDVKAQDVEKIFSKDGYEINKNNIVDIKEAKQKAITAVAEDIKNEITQEWKNWAQFDEIVITGGGANVLGEKLKELIKDATIVENSQKTNADGFYKYGEFLKGE